jgi:rhodanese-related sulfurtransferase
VAHRAGRDLDDETVVARDVARRDPGFVLADSRSTEAWDQGHIPGALHLPTALVPEQAGQLLDRSVPVVTYCRRGRERRDTDPLTAPVDTGDCGC